MVYLDFRSAFNQVDFGVLMHCLKSLGISGKIGRFIFEFLTGRRERVQVENTLGDWYDIISGVGQGTVSGPILFIIALMFINKNILGAYFGSFADDSKIAKGVNCCKDRIDLQENLEKIYEWAKKNNMSFNASKFKSIRFGKGFDDIEQAYTSNESTKIEDHTSVTDLGVIMSSDLSFSAHLSYVLEKSRKTCGLILRTFQSREKKALLILLKTLVLSQLDYCCSIWSPTEAGKLNQLEAVQKSFTKRISAVSYLNYNERLKFLGLYSIQRRIERYEILYTFKNVNNIVPNPGLKFFKDPRTGLHVIVPGVSTNCKAYVRWFRERSFSIRGPRLFNNLPITLKKDYGNTTSLEKFKAELDKYLKTIPDQPTCSRQPRAANSNSLLDQCYYRNCIL